MIGQVVHLDAWFDGATGRVEGYAAPAGEIAPCTIHFRNGGRLIAAARAVHFMRDATYIRAGWCGFSLGVVPSLFLFDDSLDLCCAASGNVLLSLSFADIADGWAASPTKARTAKIIDFLPSQSAIPSVEALGPLVSRIIERKGPIVAAEAMYEMLLRRPADPGGLVEVAGRLRTGHVKLAMEGMLASEEYASLAASRRLLSPFDYGTPPEMVLALVD
ncbi:MULTISPECIES: hypothetical protein [Sphingobium]|uniref:Uncharacterized protein n=1 Tax=Sphingobium lignivorans TaxID=2735886 RepID=A0ABR6NEU5_9SPHN|nr:MULTISPECIES: hypothetical protein [Sphingobium]MBB5985028.1 hypothetical protein [Sphingobium lignivorans]